MQPKQPKITQKLLLRSAIGLIALAGLVLAFRWYKERESDPFGGAQLATSGWIAAIESIGDDKHVVAIQEDGSVIRQPQPPTGSQDRDPAWRPDGNFLFFSSNRVKGKFSMFRWRPVAGDSPEGRSLGGLSQAAPFFLRADADKHAEATALITAGGRVMEYDAKRPALRQVLPPPDPNQRSEAKEEGGGNASPFEGIYDRFGTSFRKAQWTPDRTAVFAVMRGELGETLIFQKLVFSNPQDAQPQAIVAGDRVDFDMDQQTGTVFFVVQGFHWPETVQIPEQFIKNGRVTVPFRHAIGACESSNLQPQIIAQNGDKRLQLDENACFGDLAVSADGKLLAVTSGSYAGNGNLNSKGLFIVDLAQHRVDFNQAIAPGEVFEPCWSPDSSAIAFARRETPTSRPIYTVDLSSATLHRRTPEQGIFSFPTFSPQHPANGRS